MAFKGGMFPQYIETDDQNRALVVIAAGGGGGGGGGGDASAANQSSQITLETAIRDQLIAILAKIYATPATEAKQDTLIGRLPNALVSGRLSVDGSGVTQPISGNLGINNFPATQAISGNFATQATLADILAKLADPATAANQGALSTLTTAIRDRLALSGDRIKTEANIRYLTTLDEVTAAQRGNSTAVTTSVGAVISTATPAYAPILGVNTNRKGAIVFNDSTAILRLKCAETVTPASFTVKIPSQVYWELPFTYTGAISGVWEAANGFALVTEFS